MTEAEDFFSNPYLNSNQYLKSYDLIHNVQKFTIAAPPSHYTPKRRSKHVTTNERNFPAPTSILKIHRRTFRHSTA
jgi:hypothetical protein